MSIVAAVLQADVFQIGASIGVVLEFKTPNVAEARRMQTAVEIALAAAIQAHDGLRVAPVNFADIGGDTLGEVFEEILDSALRTD